jgi:predicted lysophospholipase L1 biosynthesis ABC-type transport system permease subunit
MGGHSMSTIFSSVLTIFFAIPVLGTILVYSIIKLFLKTTKKAIQKALDYTTILYVISVHFLIVTIWGKSFFWLIILVMLVMAMVFVFVHWKVKEEIIVKRVWKGFWRFNFILFSFTYFFLTFYGLVSRAITFSFSS